MRRLAPVIRALETFTFGLFLFGWLLLGAFGTWTETAPFWIGAPMLWLAAVCGLFSIHYGLQGKLSRSCTATVILFTGYILTRALSSEVVYLARPDLVFCATAFIAWVLIATRYEKPRHRFALLAVWSLIILANLGMGLWQKHLNPNANALSFLGFGRDTQDAVFCGLFPNSNHLCGFLELAAFPILALAVFGRVHSFVRMLCGLVFIAAAYSVAQSTSRGGGLAFGAGLVLFGAVAGVLHIMRRRRVPGKTTSTGLIFAAMAIVCSVIGWITWTHLEEKFGQGHVFQNMNARTELWSRAQEQWLQNPVIGTGARSFEYYETKFRSLGTPWITWSETDINARFAHNDWVQVLSDYGLIGLLLAAAVLGFHCWKALSYLLTDSYRSARVGGGFFTDHRGAIVMGALCGMIAFAIHCMADFQMHIGVNAVLAASVLALMANPGRAQSEGETPVPAGAWKITTAVAAAIPAAMLGWCFLPWAESDRQFYKARGIYDRAVGDVEDFFLASAKMQEASEADPLNYNAWLYWGYADAGSAQIFAESPQFQRPYILKALERFKTAHRLYPQNADISANIARMLDSIGSFDEAGGWFSEALEWGDGSRLIHWFYADHLMATGRYQEALDHYGYIVHRHKYGGFKRNAIQKSIDRCNELLRKAQPPPPTPQ